MLQALGRRNSTKGDDELKHLLTSQQGIKLGIITHIHLSTESIECQNYIDSDL